MKQGFLALLFSLFFLCGVVFGPPARADEVGVPVLQAHVTDLTGTLDAADIAGLDERLLAYEREKGSQLAVLIVPTTQPETIDQYALRVAEKWKLGRKGVDDGLLFLVAKDDRTMRIEVGYGLEGAVTDLLAKRIVSDIVAPLFRKGDYAGGVKAGVDALLKAMAGEELPLPDPSRGGGEGSEFPFILIGLIFVFWQIASAMGEVTVSDALTFGGVSGVLSFFLVGWGLALIVAVVVFLFTLLAPAIGTGGGRFGGWGGGGFGGGSGGGWGGGGGGGFGGGGASGGW